MVKLVCPPKNINRPCYNWQGLGCFAGALLIGIIVGVSFVLLGTRPVQTEQRELQNICKPEINLNIDLGQYLKGKLEGGDVTLRTSSQANSQTFKNGNDPKSQNE